MTPYFILRWTSSRAAVCCKGWERAQSGYPSKEGTFCGNASLNPRVCLSLMVLSFHRGGWGDRSRQLCERGRPAVLFRAHALGWEGPFRLSWVQTPVSCWFGDEPVLGHQYSASRLVNHH